MKFVPLQSKYQWNLTLTLHVTSLKNISLGAARLVGNLPWVPYPPPLKMALLPLRRRFSTKSFSTKTRDPGTRAGSMSDMLRISIVSLSLSSKPKIMIKNLQRVVIRMCKILEIRFWILKLFSLNVKKSVVVIEVCSIFYQWNFTLLSFLRESTF